MPTYQGGCHCGAVRFEVRRPEPYDRFTDCDCSLCTRKGILHSPAEHDEFTLLQGEDALTLYQFGTKTARHLFCRHCGIHVYGKPRDTPQRLTVNARCLDDFHAILPTVTVRKFDGINHPRDRGG